MSVEPGSHIPPNWRNQGFMRRPHGWECQKGSNGRHLVLGTRQFCLEHGNGNGQVDVITAKEAIAQALLAPLTINH